MSDAELRQLEREAATSDDPTVLEKLDLVRQRNGLPSLFDDLLAQQRALSKKVVNKGPALLERKLRSFLEEHGDVLKTLTWGQYNMYNDETFDFNYGHIQLEFTAKALEMIEAHNPFQNVKFKGLHHISDDYSDYRLHLLTDGGQMVTTSKRYPRWDDKDPQHKEPAILDKLDEEWAFKIRNAITDVEAFDSDISDAQDMLEVMFGRDIRITMGEDRKLSTEHDYQN